MANQSLFNISPYYDDYDEDKNFLRMLFRPGYAVQARELTQAQTILQNQIERFGNHVFEDGARVLGAGITTRPISFIRVEPKHTDASGVEKTIDSTKLIGYDLTGTGSSGLESRAKIVHMIDEDTNGKDNFKILFVEFVNGSDFQQGNLLDSSYESEVYKIKMAGISGAVQYADGITGAEINGEANLVSVDEGVFFVDGFFVKSQQSSVVPYGYTSDGASEPADTQRYFRNPTARVGFDIDRGNISTSEDNTLRDPSSGSYNFNAPGADRYRVKLNMDFKGGFTGSDKNFIELLKYDEGSITYKLIKTNYAELENTLARRTHDESGSYTVKPFEIDIRENLKSGNNRGINLLEDGGSEDKLSVGLKSGKAYVFGHEFESLSTEYVTVDKARTTSTYTGSTFDAVHGNYFIGSIPASRKKGIAWLFSRGDINKAPMEVVLATEADSEPFIATAKIHKVEKENSEGGGYRIYVYDIQFESGFDSLETVSVIRTKASDGPSVNHETLFNVNNVVYNRDNNILVFPVGEGSAVKNFDRLSYSFKKTYKFAITGTGEDGDDDDYNNYKISIGETDSNDGFATFKFDDDVEDISKYTVWKADTTSDTSSLPDTTLVNATVNVDTNRTTLSLDNLDADGNTHEEGDEYIVQATIVYNDTLGTHTIGRRTKRLSSSTETELTRKTSTDGQIYFELPDADVYEILGVTGSTTTEGESTPFDPSNDFLFDNGQRDNAYLPARLWVKENKRNVYTEATGGFLFKASYHYFQHEGGPGPFTVDSYSANGFTYGNIPLYTSKNLKKTYSLANVLDFRHIKPEFPEDPIDWNTFTIENTSRIPDTRTRSSIKTNYTYYLSRIDKVVLKNSLNGDVAFDVIKGVDALVPKVPADTESLMTLYTLTIPAYTHNPEDVGIKFVDNKRHTMKDLGKIENRVNDLEYFTTLSLLENEIDSRVIYSVDSTTDPAFKNGILVDGFKGHNIGDVSHVDYSCSIDYEKGHLRPSFVPVNVGLEFASIPDNLELSSDGLITYKNKEAVSYIEQPSSSTTIQANPFAVANWLGTVSMESPTINWFDTSSRPIVKVNSQGENDNWKVSTVNSLRGFGTQWNDWNTNWYGVDVVDDLDDRRGKSFLSQARVKDTGVPVVRNRNETNVSSVTRDTSTTREEKNRIGLSNKFLPDHIQKVIGSKVIDVSVIPFIESQGITLNAYGLKPNTGVNCFFDGVNVDAHCSTGGIISGPFITDANGKLGDILFTIPSNTFESGEKIFRFIDDTNGKLTNATTCSDGILYANGASNNREGNILSTRPALLRRQTVKSEQIIKNPYMRRKSLDISKYTNWIDPLSQIFYVDEVSHPKGLFLESVDLYFSDIDSSIPVKVDIRPTINGVPSPSLVVPFSEVWKSGVTYDSSSGVNAENFKFGSYVYLEPGEYALSVSANSGNYKLHVGEVGEDAIDGLERISLPIHSGPLFKPTNSREAEPDSMINLKYKINRCSFKGVNSSKTLKLQHKTQGSNVVIDEYQLNHSTVVPSGTSVTNTAVFDSNTNIISGKSNTAISSSTLLADTAPTTDSFEITLASDTSSEITDVSPVLDAKYLNFVCVENKVNNKLSSTDGTDNDESNAFGSASGSIAKYITRRVTLEDDFEAKNLKVFLDLNQQGAGGDDVNIEVYTKFTSKSDETDFNDKGYVKMDVENSSDQFVSENEFDFREVSYTLPTDSIPTEDVDRIKSFAIKICMYRRINDDGTPVSVVPVVKDLRVVALDS